MVTQGGAAVTEGGAAVTQGGAAVTVDVDRWCVLLHAHMSTRSGVLEPRAYRTVRRPFVSVLAQSHIITQ